ncbi:hypothetical protein CapIbe_000236 [Capra ibex]
MMGSQNDKGQVATINYKRQVLAGGFTRFGGPRRPHKSGTPIGMTQMAEVCHGKFQTLETSFKLKVLNTTSTESLVTYVL